MAEQYGQLAGHAVAITVIALIVTESLLSARWNRMYFTSGLPLFAVRIPIELHQNTPPSESELEEHLQSDLLGSLTFMQVAPRTFGFREGRRRPLMPITPLMHGMLLFDDEHRVVVVKGFANWFISAVFLFGLVIAIVNTEPLIKIGFPLFILALAGLLYAVQAARFSKVARVAAEAWSRKYPPLHIGGNP